jgi:hypothetical protein
VDYESQLRLEGDAIAVRAALEAVGGQLTHRHGSLAESDAPVDPPGLYWAVIQPSEPDFAVFVARVLWTVYPDRPPSLLFATEIGGPTNVGAAWPAAQGYRAPNDVCKPFTAEGQSLHGEWASGPNSWRSEGNPFLYVIETVQTDINRAKGARAG